MRQTVFAHGDFDFHAAVGIVAQHFQQFGHGGLVVVRIAFDAGGNDLPGLRLERGHGIGFQNDGLAQPLVFGLHNRHAVFDVEAADHFGLRPFDDVEHLPFAAAAPVGAGGAHGDDVAVHQVAHFALVQHEIGLLGLLVERHGETEAVFVRFDAAFDQFQLLRRAHRAAPVDQHLPVARHRFEAAFKENIFVFFHRQHGRQRGHAQRHAFFFDDLDDPFAAGQGKFVTLPLPREEGVFFAQV